MKLAGKYIDIVTEVEGRIAEDRDDVMHQRS